MRRSTTSAGTRRALLGLLLAELMGAVLLLGRPAAAPHPNVPTAAAAASSVASPAAETRSLPDGRSVQLIGLGGPRTTPLLDRIAGELSAAADAVTAFWGPDWPRHIVVAAAGSDEQFAALAGGGADIAAATTGQRIMFAPGAAAMSPAALRIVVRHELFHYAARAATAADAPRWLTEGVADFVARPPTPPQLPAHVLAQLPSDADLDTAGDTRSLAYDRAWWFTRFVADRYGTAALRALYVRACGVGHPDVATALRDTLGAGPVQVLNDWRQWLA
jgi:hypothetical protein